MTKEQLQERIEALRKDRKQSEAMCIMIDGALQDCEHWINQLDKEPEDEKAGA
jgi:hypothetical protein